MDYSFQLDFLELDEELQDQKVDEVIEFNFNNGEYTNEDGENEKDLYELLNDETIRKVEQNIMSRGEKEELIDEEIRLETWLEN